MVRLKGAGQWDCAHPKNRVVTPEFVNTADAMKLQRFGWLDDKDIGELDVRWNWLVGEYDHPPADVKNAHWTVGGPYFEEYVDAAFADEWFKERDLMQHCLQRKKV